MKLYFSYPKVYFAYCKRILIPSQVLSLLFIYFSLYISIFIFTLKQHIFLFQNSKSFVYIHDIYIPNFFIIDKILPDFWDSDKSPYHMVNFLACALNGAWCWMRVAGLCSRLSRLVAYSFRIAYPSLASFKNWYDRTGGNETERRGTARDETGQGRTDVTWRDVTRPVATSSVERERRERRERRRRL